MRLRDTTIFIFNTVSGLIFMALALFFSCEFWPFIAYAILPVLACVAAFRDEWRKHPGKTTRRAIMMIPRIRSIWSAGGAALYLFFYVAILAYPDFLFYAIILSAFCIADTFVELGRFLARVAVGRRAQS